MNSTEKCEYLKTINHLGNEEFYKKLDEVGFQKYKEQKMERPSHDETEELWDSITGKIDKEPELTYDSFKGILYDSLIDAIWGYKKEIDEKGMKGTNFVQKDNQLDVWDKTNDNDALEWWGGLTISEKMGVRRQFGLADQIGISLVDVKLMYELDKSQTLLNNKLNQEAMEKSSQNEEEMGADRYKIITDIKAISEEEKTTVLNERYKIVIDMTNCDDTKFLRSLVKYISDGAMTIKIEPIDGTK
jgi:hypothetical protein